MKLYFLLITFLSSITLTYSQVKFQPPVGPEGKIIQCLAADTKGNLYAAGGGLFRSTNNGDTWEPNKGAPGSSTIAVDTNGFILSGTYRSRNHGKTWENFAKGFNEFSYVRILKIAGNGNIFAGTNEGIYISNDNGFNYTRVCNAGSNVMEIELYDDGTVIALAASAVLISKDYGLTWERVKGITYGSIERNADGVFFATSGSSIYSSTDGGYTWTIINEKAYVSTIFIPDGKTILALGYQEGIKISHDNGVSWQLASAGNDDANISTFFKLNDYIFSAGYAGIFRTENLGASWSQQNKGLGISAPGSLVIGPNNEYFITNYGGIYRSTDSGKNWTSIKNNISAISFAGIEGLTMSPSGKLLVYGYNSIYVSEDKGENWQRIDNDIFKNGSINSVYFYGDTLFVSAENQFYKTSDYGLSWQFISNISLKLVYISSDGIMYSDGITCSTDGGVTWNHVRYMDNDPAVVINSVGHVFAAEGRYGIIRSTDGWKTFVELGKPELSWRPGAAAVNSNGYVFIADDQGDILYTPDNGRTWDNYFINSKLFQGSLWNMMIDKDDYLYLLSRDSGIYKTEMPVFSEKKPNFYVDRNTDLGRIRINKDNDSVLAFCNIGNDTVKISSVQHNSDEFTLQVPDFTLPPHSAYYNRLDYLLPKLGKYNSEFIISHNSEYKNDTVTISAFGYGIPKIEFNQDTIDFGMVDVDSVKYFYLKILNTGDDTLKIKEQKIKDQTVNSIFFESKDIFTSVPPGEEITDTIKFMPGWMEIRTASLIITSNTESINDTVFLKGTGIGTPKIEVFGKDTLDFSELLVNDKAVDSVNVYNSGEDTLNIKIRIIGSSAFTAESDTFSLAPFRNVNDRIGFIYNPSKTGIDTALVILENNSGLPSIKLFLYGRCADVISQPGLKSRFELMQNYPNPFNPETRIEFMIPLDGVTSLKIFNMLGEEVTTLFDGLAQTGKYYSVKFNADGLPAGVYFSVLRYYDKQKIKKMIYLK